MSDSRTVFLVGPPSPLRERLAQRLEVHAEDVLDTIQEFLLRTGTGSDPVRDEVSSGPRDPTSRWVATEDPAAAGSGGGIVLLLADNLSAGECLHVLERLALGFGEWTPCLVRHVMGEVTVRPVSMGWIETVDDVIRCRDGNDERLLELRRLVTRMAHARHDINDAITSGLAETELLLMDSAESNAADALGAVVKQFHRIRDMVSVTTAVRPGRDSS